MPCVFCFALGIVVVARASRLAPGHSFLFIRPVFSKREVRRNCNTHPILNRSHISRISLNSKAHYDPAWSPPAPLRSTLREANIVFAIGLDHKIWCMKLRLVPKFEDNP